MDNFSIFNHFDESESGVALVPECRSNSAPVTPGFTCGSDPTLTSGTTIVVRGVPVIDDESTITDERRVKLLLTGRYGELEAALQSSCPDHDDNECETIDYFQNGCDTGSSDVVDGLVVFDNPFNQPDCGPKVTYHTENDSLIEERQIYLGYDDLVDYAFGAKVDSHKIYEISCKIKKVGQVDDEIIVEQTNTIVDHHDELDTNFYIEKYFGDITDETTRRPLTDTEVVPFSPNANQNDRFQFKISSDHSDEYVHLEACSIKTSDGSFDKEFINDGCVKDEFQFYFTNGDRNERVNEDWFNMRPILQLGTCKSTWIIDCTVSSCNRGLDQDSKLYEDFCKPGDECADRYTATFMSANARKRRSTDNVSSPAEAHVISNLVHPCYYVDEHKTRYCVDDQICWTLPQCAATFPNDFPQVPNSGTDSEADSELHAIMKEFEAAIQEHIDERMSKNQAVAHEHVMESIRDNANRVLTSKQTFEDAVEEIIRLINTL